MAPQTQGERRSAREFQPHAARQQPGEAGLARLFIAGRWVETDERLHSHNPATGAVIGAACVAGPAEVAAAVAAARSAQAAWADLPWPQRRAHLAVLRTRLLQDREEWADLLVQEAGKPRAEAITVDILPALECLAYYMRHTGPFLRPRGVPMWEPWFLGKRGWVEPRPLGVVAIISPWNFPVSITFTMLVPALAAGNTVVLKPSEEVPLLGGSIARLCAAAGLPPGVVNVINGGAATGRQLVQAGVDKVAFTGSGATARRILADLAGSVTPALMELGGKDAMIVLPDADIEHSARGAVAGAFLNCGQVCVSVERVYVHRAVAAPFIRRVVELAGALRVGPGGDPTTDVGPLISERQRQAVHAQVTAAVAAGARVRCGGAPLADRAGYFYPPTVLTDVIPGMDVMREETFGPVLPIQVVADEDEAVRLANDSTYGLSASVWTRHLAHGRAVGRRLRAGMVTVNDHASTWGAMRLPWGGVGESGYGRSHGHYALQEFTHPRVLVQDALRMRKFWWYPYGQRLLDLFDPLQSARHDPRPAGRLRGWLRLLPALWRFWREH